MRDLSAISYIVKKFFSDPIKAGLLLALAALVYLYVDNRMVYESQISRQEKRIELLEQQINDLQFKLLETVEKNKQ